MAQSVHVALQGLPEFLAHKVSREHEESLASPVQQAWQDQVGPEDFQDLPEKMERPEMTEKQARKES